jgi:hypothetical protein
MQDRHASKLRELYSSATDPQHGYAYYVSYAYYRPPMMPPCPLAIVPALARTWAGHGRAPPLILGRMPASRTHPNRGVYPPYDPLMAPAAPTLQPHDGEEAYHFRLQPFVDQASFTDRVSLESLQSQSGGKRRLELQYQEELDQYQEELDQDPLLEKVVTEITRECIREWPAITNEKQRKRIEQRRLMAMRGGFVPQAHHPSRQDHASRRPRDPSGRFLGKEDSAPFSAASKPEGSNDADAESSLAPPAPPVSKGSPQPAPRPATKTPTTDSNKVADLALSSLQDEMHEAADRFNDLKRRTCNGDSSADWLLLTAPVE